MNSVNRQTKTARKHWAGTLAPGARVLGFVMSIVIARSASAADVPRAFDLSDIEIRLEDTPRWPTGEAVVTTVSGLKGTVTRTKLPCNPCQSVTVFVPLTEAQVLDLLNRGLAEGFFELNGTYDTRPTYFRGTDGKIQLGATMTTDEDRQIITVRIGAWTKRVVNEGEAPEAFKAFADAMRKTIEGNSGTGSGH